jgi:tRNA threonylcarbamoyladenosine biosynthesis protein TsaE
MFTSQSIAETEEAGARIAHELKPGDVLALRGELGAGKTHFIKGIARGLGCGESVTSPTFTLVHEYSRGRLPVYHFDFYRLDNVGALREVGFEEYISGNGVSVIEWADKFPEALPPHTRWIDFAILSESARTIAVR